MVKKNFNVTFLNLHGIKNKLKNMDQYNQLFFDEVCSLIGIDEFQEDSIHPQPLSLNTDNTNIK
jgi:hypothetical protein